MRLYRQRLSPTGSAGDFQYPQHLRDSVGELPAAPGVYIFHGDSEALPLYIGKSVNIRSRVLSHLRNTEEVRLLRQTTRISHIRTAGEIGALLLEASLIKQQQPLYNQKLRRTKQLCSWYLAASGAQIVYSKDVNFAIQPDLYGLFSGKRAAMEAMYQLADRDKLCYGVLGLEKRNQGKPCFRFMLQQCAGACCGKEDNESHHARLKRSLEHLQVQCWPYAGAIALVERFNDEVQMHVISQWSYLGSVQNPTEARALARQAAGFDADGYKILCRPILGGQSEIIAI